MANYVEVKNNNGTVTIDDTHPRLVKTRTVTLNTNYHVAPEADRYAIRGYISDAYLIGGYSTQDITLNSNEKFVAIRAKRTRENVIVLGGFTSSNKYQISLFADNVDNNPHAGDFLVDIYGTVPSSGGTSSGLEVFNASGTKIFDSDYYTMDVAGTYNVFSKGYELFTEAPNSYSMGGHSISNRAVAINTSIIKPLHHMKSGIIMVIGVYGVVFGSTIHLEKRVCNYIEFLYSGGEWTPHGYSHSCSGIILNTKNIT